VKFIILLSLLVLSTGFAFSDVFGELLASSVIGGANHEENACISVNSQGEIILVMQTKSIDLPTTSGVISEQHFAEDDNDRDIYIAKLSNDLQTINVATYFGGIADDGGCHFILDNEDNIYLSGFTKSSDFPYSENAYAGGQGSNGYFLAKISSDLKQVIAATGISKSGGSKYIAIDNSDNVFITGSMVDPTFQVSENAFDKIYGDGTYETFIMKFDSNLTTLLSSTFIGGNANDDVRGIAIDQSQNIFVVGSTHSTDFQVSENAFDSLFVGSNEAYILKTNNDLTTLLSSTFIGGDNVDGIFDIKLDSVGDVVVAGDTSSVNFPIISGAYDVEFGGNSKTDGFILKINNDLTNVISSTFIGGSDRDGVLSLALLENDDIVVTGYTSSVNFPIISGAYDDQYGGGGDIFSLKINNDLTNVISSTFVGDGAEESPNTLALDSLENVYLSGRTQNVFPITENVVDSTIEELEGFIVKFSNSFSLIDDKIPPIITIPNNLDFTTLDPSGKIITYEIIVTDDVDQTPEIICTPQSQTVFSVGETNVTCIATDQNGNESQSSFTITVQLESSSNSIPMANAGEDQTVNINSIGTLDGSLSSDADDDTITYHWVQTSGTPVTLTDDTIVNPQLTTPNSDDTLSFMLTVSDGIATSNPDVVNIYIGSLVPIPIPPPPPTSLSTTSLDSSVKISWQSPSDNGGETITDYIIEYKKEVDSTWQVYDDGTTPTTTITISGLTNNENYQFRISSVSLAGVGAVSSLISEIPIEYSSETVETVPESETVPEPIVETPIISKELLSFVDESKDPQTYVERYITEPSYKEWFDSNYPDYTIYEGIGITEDEYLIFVDSLDEPVVTKPQEIIVDSEPTSNIKDQEPTCGAGTIIKDGICVVDTAKSEPTCGAGTVAKDGICVVDTAKQLESESSSKGGGCLIATATYGSELAPQVQQLRELRDNQLLSTTSGTHFMNTFNSFYYSFSPIIADYERENPVFKEAVKITLTPLISSLSILNYVDMDSESKVLGYGISLIVLNLGMYFVAPVIVIHKIRKFTC
jgi:hypothetical protein